MHSEASSNFKSVYRQDAIRQCFLVQCARGRLNDEFCSVRHFCYLCGTQIIQSAVAREIEEAVQAHYRICTLFEVPDMT